MSKAISISRFAKLSRHAARMSWRVIRAVGGRAYAVAMLAVICWLTFLSVRYLVRSLILPTGTPQQIAGIPTRMTTDLLKTEVTDWKGIAATDVPRMPAAHYHRVDSWIEPDRFNDCTRSGCHNALPHNRHKEVRAFLNMHATSVHCGVCHMQTDKYQLALTWYDLETGAAQEPPAILALYDLLNTPDFLEKISKNPTKDDQKKIVGLLKLATRDSGDMPSLVRLTDHFAAVGVTSNSFQRLVEETRAALPRYFRGEYGAKLAMRDSDGRPILAHPGTESAVASFLAEPESVSGAERDALLEKVHPKRRTEALKCLDCHHPEKSLIPFADLGYPDQRIKALVDPTIFEMIQNIDAGRSFNMPGFIAPSAAD